MASHQDDRTRRAETAFTVIEVVIAVLVLLAVASAIGMAAVGGAKSRGSARLQAALTNAGEQAQEDVATDRDWMTVAACKVIDSPCDISDYVRASSLELKDVDGSAVLNSATSTALDSGLDGLGDADSDGVIPDYYRIAIELQAADDVAARFAINPDKTLRRFVTTIDRRGVEQVGSIAVQACRVLNQADERMQVQGCAATGRSDIRMNPCAPGADAECTGAFGWVAPMPPSEDGPSAYVSLRRVPVDSYQFTLVDTSTLQTWPSSSASKVNGEYVFQNLPAGEFRIEGLPDTFDGTERWRSKELPSFHGSIESPSADATIAVDPGVRAQALIVFRPVTNGSIKLHFDRTVEIRHINPALQTSTEVSDAPTDEYTGSTAAEMCEGLQASSNLTTWSCSSLVPSATKPNCFSATVSGEYVGYVGPGLGNFTMVAGVLTPTLLPGTGDYMKYVLDNTPMAEFCSSYRDTLVHYFYRVDKGFTPGIRDGAVKANKYFVEPAPDARHVEYGPNGPFLANPQCIVPKRGQCTATARVQNVASAAQADASWEPDEATLISNLKPGLNTGVKPESQSASTANSNVSGWPSWLSKALWVRPSGALDGPDGQVHESGTTINLRGKGECLWTGPKYAGELEGSCKPCEPVWEPGAKPGDKAVSIEDACIILVRTDWYRAASQSMSVIDPVTGAFTLPPTSKPIDQQGGTILYEVPWGCTGDVPRVLENATCDDGIEEETSGGGGGGGGGSSSSGKSKSKSLPSTSHKSSSGSEGKVKAKKLGKGGGL